VSLTCTVYLYATLTKRKKTLSLKNIAKHSQMPDIKKLIAVCLNILVIEASFFLYRIIITVLIIMCVPKYASEHNIYLQNIRNDFGVALVGLFCLILILYFIYYQVSRIKIHERKITLNKIAVIVGIVNFLIIFYLSNTFTMIRPSLSDIGIWMMGYIPAFLMGFILPYSEKILIKWLNQKYR
jgi:hypothetical protein